MGALTPLNLVPNHNNHESQRCWIGHAFRSVGLALTGAGVRLGVWQPANVMAMSPVEGWYPDPAGNPSLERYWDGAAWTSNTRPIGGDMPIPPPPAPSAPAAATPPPPGPAAIDPLPPAPAPPAADSFPPVPAPPTADPLPPVPEAPAVDPLPPAPTAPAADPGPAPAFADTPFTDAPPAADPGGVAAIPPAPVADLATPDPAPAPAPMPPTGGGGAASGMGASSIGGISTELLTDARFAEVETNERVVRQNSRLLKVRLGEDVLAKQGSMVAFQGQIDFDHEGSGAAKFLKKAMTGEGLPLMRCTGQGELFLADSGYQVHIIHLDGAGLTVNGRNVLAFEPSLSWDIERIKGGAMMAGGLFNTRLEGHGWVAITTDGDPVVLRTDQPTFADTDAAVAWSSSLTTTLNKTVKAQALIGRGSGEAVQLAFQGEGIVIVQPSEGSSVPPPA